jgi:hypothetical protein
MRQRTWIISAAALLGIGNVPAGTGVAQDVQDLYRITGSVSSSHVEYHPIVIPKGNEVVLADLRGPGKGPTGISPTISVGRGIRVWS